MNILLKKENKVIIWIKIITVNKILLRHSTSLGIGNFVM